MKSRITIEIDFDANNAPFIQIISRDSDDVRDRLLSSFLQKFGGDSSWCKIKWEYYSQDSADQFQRISLKPISPEQLKEEGFVMLEQARVRKSYFDRLTSEPPQGTAIDIAKIIE